ncbi:MAG: ZIP family metal transporter [Lachnospiraceae bacterium]
MNGIFLALLGTMATFLVTVLGSAVIFFVRNEVSDNLQCGFLGFAGGVMVAASVWSLILPGIDFAEENGQIGWLVMTVGFLAGVLVLLVADGCLNRYLKKDERKRRPSSIKKRARLY